MSLARKAPGDFVCCFRGGLESEHGHPFSRMGRVSRAEKSLLTAVSKDVFGQVLSWAQSVKKRALNSTFLAL
jgi:hypothetical protein